MTIPFTLRPPLTVEEAIGMGAKPFNPKDLMVDMPAEEARRVWEHINKIRKADGKEPLFPES